MEFIGLSKLLKGACMFLVKGIFFLIPGKELSNGLIEMKDDSDLPNCIALGFMNQKVVDMFVEHHGYDLSHWTQSKIKDDEVYDFGKMEDLTGYVASDFVREDDVVILNSKPSGKELDIDSDDEDVDKHLRYTITEADFGMLELDDIEFLYLEQTEETE
ncbi:hypothetical protein Tco_0020224 [Tanacetum coccineum]